MEQEQGLHGAFQVRIFRRAGEGDRGLIVGDQHLKGRRPVQSL